MIWYSNPDFRINLASDPDVCRIANEVLWIHYLVGVSHFAQCRENRPMIVSRNANKSPKIHYSVVVREVGR